jgi:hypothetical protein
MRKEFTIICLIALAISTFILPTAASESTIDYAAYRASWDILASDESQYTCVDYAIVFSRENPGWGFVGISPDAGFHHMPHMINYKLENNTLVLYDNTYSMRYEIENFSCDTPVYLPYHSFYSSVFDEAWDGEIYMNFMPTENNLVRYFVEISDNREILFN